MLRFAAGAAGAVGVIVLGAVLYESGMLRRAPADAGAVDAPAQLVAQVPDEGSTDAAQGTLPDAPSIDTFRLEPDGSLLVAGRSEPGWRTSVMLDGAPFEEVTLDADGQFVTFLTLEASAAPRVLSLSMRDEGGLVIASEDEIILAPVLGTAEDADAAPQVVLRSDADGVELLQPASDPADTGGDSTLADGSPALMSAVALDAISYSAEGAVQLAGRGQSDGHVRVYLDNKSVLSVPVAEDGNWRADLPEVDTGVYTLRVDEIDAGGQVTSRVETPFKREDEAVLAAGNLATAQAVTVQPGSTLWAISRERYGDGLLYLRVFEANRERIRNPDLIYPGQVFALPE